MKATMIFSNLPHPVNRIKKLLNKSDGGETVRTECEDSTSGCEAFEMIDSSVQVKVDDEDDLISFWKGLKRGVFKYTTSIHFTFSVSPTQTFGHIKQLGEVFEVLGKMPLLEEVTFIDSAIFLKSVNKLFREALLRKLKFHRCNFIVAKKAEAHFWAGIKRQQKLEVLEIAGCTTIPFDKVRHSRFCLIYKQELPKFSFCLPHFLQEQRLPTLRRLVLDSCILDCQHQRDFFKLLNHNMSLEELEIRPMFEPKVSRRRDYHKTKKQAISNFLTKTVPTTLASSNNKCLRKLVVSLDDNLLEQVYDDAMLHWIELVHHKNYTLTHANITDRPLLFSDAAKGNGGFGLYKSSWLECNLQYYLRLNRQLHSRQVLPNEAEVDSIREEVMPDLVADAIDVSLLRTLLQSSPDARADTQSAHFLTRAAMFSSTRSLPV